MDYSSDTESDSEYSEEVYEEFSEGESVEELGNDEAEPNFETWESKVYPFPASEFQSVCGPKENKVTPIECFYLFFSDTIWEYLVLQTNKYSKECFEKELNEEKREKLESQWKDVTVEEMKAFIAAILYSGVCQVPNWNYFWNEGLSGNFIRQTFIKSRFMQIKRYFHVGDNDDNDKGDSLYKIRFIYDKIRDYFRFYWRPHQIVVIDEGT
jgi:hypothetical protein